MRIVFMGTPEFAVASLEALLQAGHEIIAVFTRADTPKNRGMKMLPPPVKVTALAHDIPVYQPKTLRDPEMQEVLRQLAPELIVVAAYGRMLPQEVLDLPRYGCINVHASLLPKYRGASPINAAVLNDEKESGVTIMQMNAGLDTGDMLLAGKVDIASDETYGQLHDRLAKVGGEVLLQAIEQIAAGTVQAMPQDDALSTYAHMIHSKDCQVSFTQSDAKTVSCSIRGYDPFPGAFGYLGEEKLKLFGAVLEDADFSGEAGTIVKCDKHGMVVACTKGTVRIRQVQGAGGKKMDADAFFRGHQAMLNMRFS